jgi:hypothetical protein
MTYMGLGKKQLLVPSSDRKHPLSTSIPQCYHSGSMASTHQKSISVSRTTDVGILSPILLAQKLGPSNPGPCTNSVGVLGLKEISEIIVEEGLVLLFLSDIMIKQITCDNQWVGYDDNETIALKTEWADEICLGGTAIWSIDFNSGPGRQRLPHPQDDRSFTKIDFQWGYPLRDHQ